MRTLHLLPAPFPFFPWCHWQPCLGIADRTGEISGAYYVAYENYNITAAFARDTVECGRPPNYFSKGALMW